MTIVAVECSRCHCEVEAEQPADYETNKYVRKFWAKCFLCDECRSKVEQEAREQDQAHEQELHLQRRAPLERRSRIPLELQGLTWEQVSDPSRPDALAAARSWATGPRKGLFLSGPVGVGKTWLAAAAAWAMLDHRPVRWCSVVQLRPYLGLDFKDPRRADALEVLLGTEALVLDDIDKASPNMGAEIYAAVDSRVTAGAPILITTNLGLDRLESKFPDEYGAAIVSRIVQHCRGGIFQLTGPDRRLMQAVAA